MRVRLLRRRNSAADWALRLSALPIPLLLLAMLLGHRGLIEPAALFVVIGLSIVLAGLALLAAASAFRAIWRDGDSGTGAAIGATILSLIVLALPGAITLELVRLPRLADISTDGVDPPLFTAAPESVSMRPLPDDAKKAAQAEAYPDLVARHFPQSPARVQQAVAALVAARGWTVTDQRAPDEDNEVGWIEARATSLVFALPVDVVIRIIADEPGTLVDMRSASRIGAHDLGDNARRIRSFLSDLDAALQKTVEPDDDARPDADTAGPLPPLPPPAPAGRR